MKAQCFSVFILLFFSLVTTTTASAIGNINGFIGVKNLKSEDWEPAEEHVELGLMVDFAPNDDFPVNVAFSILSSGDETTYFEEVLLYTGNKLLFAGLLDDGKEGYDGNKYDFELILPNSQVYESVVYYVYIERI